MTKWPVQKTNTQNDTKHLQHHDATDISKNYIFVFFGFFFFFIISSLYANKTNTPFISIRYYSFCILFSLSKFANSCHRLNSPVQCLTVPVSVREPVPLRVERVGLSNTWIIVIDQAVRILV